MSSQEAVSFVRKRLPPPGSKKKLVPVLEELLDTCCADNPTQRGGLGCDNVTAVLVRFEDPKAVAVLDEGGGECDEVEERILTDSQTKRLEAAVFSSLQRLKSGGLRRTESQEEKEAREAEEKEEREAQEQAEKERLERRKRREEREEQKARCKKKVKMCLAADDEDDDDEDEF